MRKGGRGKGGVKRGQIMEWVGRGGGGHAGMRRRDEKVEAWKG
jgi:hypothetical protein